MKEFVAELVLEAGAELAEGPVWDPDRGLLWWVDIPPGHVHAFDPSTGRDTRYEVGSPVGAVALRGDGTIVVAARDAVLALDPESRDLTRLVDFPGTDVTLRSNDGKCDPQGRFLVGRMALDATAGVGELCRLDADLQLTALMDGLTIPNGLAWRSDGRLVYFVDSSRNEIMAFAYDPIAGTIGAKPRVLRLTGEGVPDGMTIDTEDCLWVALWDGASVMRLSPDGELLATVRLPVTRPSSCTFGGPNLDELFLTSAREGLTAAELQRQPLAGSLFRVRPGQRGRPPVPFAG